MGLVPWESTLPIWFQIWLNTTRRNQNCAVKYCVPFITGVVKYTFCCKGKCKKKNSLSYGVKHIWKEIDEDLSHTDTYAKKKKKKKTTNNNQGILPVPAMGEQSRQLTDLRPHFFIFRITLHWSKFQSVAIGKKIKIKIEFESKRTILPQLQKHYFCQLHVQ